MIPFIDSTLVPFILVLAEWSLRLAVLIGLLAVCLFIARPRRASTRGLVCWMVLLAGLLLPALPHWGPGFGMPNAEPQARLPGSRARENLPYLERKEMTSTPGNIDGSTKVSQARPPGGRAWQGRPFPEKVIGPDTPEETHSAEGTPPPAADAELWGTRRIVIVTIALLWAGGVLVLSVRWIGGLMFLDRLRRTALPVQGRPAQVFDACCQELNLRRKANLATHPAVHSPVTLGLAHPTVLVPVDWPSQSDSIQRGALLHELAHLARYDDWSALILDFTRVFFFFHPLVHWLLARLERERELLCDEAAISRGIDRHDYARMLVEFSRQAGSLRPMAVIATSYPIRFGSRRTVKIRIHQLLEETMSSWKSPLSLRRAISIGIVTLAFAILLGSVRIKAVSPEEAPVDNVKTSDSVSAQERKQPKEEQPYRVQPFHVLKIRVLNVSPDGINTIIAGNFLVEPEGKVDLGPDYGKVPVKELTLEEATDVVTKYLRQHIKDPKASVTLAGWVTRWQEDRKAPYRIKPFHLLKIRVLGTPPGQPIDGAHLVEPGGRVDLGPGYAKVPVGDMSLEEATDAVTKYLRQQLKDPKVSVTLAGWENDWLDLEKQGVRPDSKASTKTEGQKTGLRYGGKSFDQWRSELTTELKPEVRVEGLKAMSAFGANGLAHEATTAIIEVMRGYDILLNDEGDNKVIEAAINAMRKIGPEAVPALIGELKEGKRNGRHFAIAAIQQLRPEKELLRPAVIQAIADKDPLVRRNAIDALGTPNPQDKDHISSLMKAVKDRDQETRLAAVNAFAGMGANPNAIRALSEALRDEDIGIRLRAADSLGGLGIKARPAIPNIVQALKDENVELRRKAISALQIIKPDAKSVVPALIESLKDEDQTVWNGVVTLLGSFGPQAKDAVSALVKELSNESRNKFFVVNALAQIGPEAKEAVPALTELVKKGLRVDPTNVDLPAAARQALEKIAK